MLCCAAGARSAERGARAERARSFLLGESFSAHADFAALATAGIPTAVAAPLSRERVSFQLGAATGVDRQTSRSSSRAGIDIGDLDQARLYPRLIQMGTVWQGARARECGDASLGDWEPVTPLLQIEAWRC